MREFLHVEDLAESVRFILEYNGELGYDLLNAGTGKDLTIKELAATIQRVIGYDGSIEWDSSKPDGTSRKLMDVNRLTNLGWNARIELRKGIEQTYQWFVEHISTFKEVEIN